MKHLSTLFVVLPFLAIACGSEPATQTNEVSSARASLALGEGEGEEQVVTEGQTVESSEEPRLELVAADAGAPTAPEAEQPEAEQPVVGDAGAPPVTEEDPPVVSPEPQPEEPQPEEPQAEQQPEPVPPACVEGETRCVDEDTVARQTCVGGEWVTAESCDFVCNSGACVTCIPGWLQCSSADDTVFVCAEDATIRETVRTGVSCDMPEDVMSLPIVNDPPRLVRLRFGGR